MYKSTILFDFLLGIEQILYSVGINFASTYNIFKKIYTELDVFNLIDLSIYKLIVQKFFRIVSFSYSE